ncbi:MAG: GNAT family N-acetyltransferase [Nanoarchaeota archaeon]|nr:GNAT family N-acetyltransferase [Nanoarchaeota archaeon]MBU1854178.1 GNAT family N-acetyltransferase [Nanoarchaeota archaeon]
MKLVAEVMDLYFRLLDTEKDFLPGMPTYEFVLNGLYNFELYQEAGIIPEIDRTGLSTVETDVIDNVVGFQHLSVMNNAIPSIYEQKYIGLSSPMNYIHLQYFMVDSEFRGQGVSDKMISKLLDIGEKLSKEVVADVFSDNQFMLNTLSRYGFSEQSKWSNRHNRELLRLSKN